MYCDCHVGLCVVEARLSLFVV
uniref:Uncharacterized protein n=1 Tax=Heterorhabditis bacteriophora TaxID=37862 RepID=A0A1I7WEE3_HETBA